MDHLFSILGGIIVIGNHCGMMFSFLNSKKDIELLSKVLNTLAFMLNDENVAVQKRVMLCITHLYKHALQVRDACTMVRPLGSAEGLSAGGGGGACVSSLFSQHRNIFSHNTGWLAKFGWIQTYLKI